MTSSSCENPTYVLGIDLGVTSLGWALLRCVDGDVNTPAGIEATGVRIFEAGVEGSPDDIAKGKDTSKAAARRLARAQRRQLARRSARLNLVFARLQAARLLPVSRPLVRDERHQFFESLDATITQRIVPAGEHRQAQLMPYLLRAKAIDERLEPFEIGRAIFHLAQRRGFLSNRKADQSATRFQADDSSDETGTQRKPRRKAATSDLDAAPRTDAEDSKSEDPGIVKAQIASLQQAMGDRTLGQYFATLDPFERRIRQRWTSRAMYLVEFDRIWNEQAQHYPELLTEEHRSVIHRAIFHQRRLKSQRGLVGRCELEPTRRRCASGMLIAQEFRILQQVNHLVLRLPEGMTRFLTQDERRQLIEALNQQQSMSYASARTLLGIPKGARFKQEAGADEKLKGNSTACRLRSIFGKNWDRLTPEAKDEVVLDVLHFQNADALRRRARKAWHLDDELAAKLADLQLEPGYARLSKHAMRKLIELMKQPSQKDPAVGMSYAEACQVAGLGSRRSAIHDLLPPVIQGLPQLKNPAVNRALTELRKVVNALIRKYGKPAAIRIELARDLKRSRKDRKRLVDDNRKQLARRNEAIRKILTEPSLGITEPRAGDIERVLLAEECDWCCPFTGDGIRMQTLLGPQSQFDIAHIFPRRYLDDSFMNKTLCRNDVNRHRMHDLLPIQAFGSNREEWDRIVQRVRHFKGPFARIKLERFLMAEVPEGFASRQLNDTRYSSTLAAEYLGLLYGGRVDHDGRQRIQCNTGGITAYVRNEWRLNSILGDGGKNRDDHRHHAVDAIAIALCGPRIVQLFGAAADSAAIRFSRRMFDQVDEPWPNFLSDARQAIHLINGRDRAVSHRVDRRVAGPLHADTIYSPPIEQPDGSFTHHVRKALHKLSLTEVTGDRIVDPRVRELVRAKFEQLRSTGAKDPKDAFADPGNHPYFISRKGVFIPIHKVRVTTEKKPKALLACSSAGHQTRQRHIGDKPGGNFQSVIVAQIDHHGRDLRWEQRLITRLDAIRNIAAAKKSRESSIGSSTQLLLPGLEPGWRVVFTLTPRDSLELDDELGQRQVYVVRSISQSDGTNEIQLQEHIDATRIKEARSKWNRITSIDGLRKRHARAVEVTPLGEIVPAITPDGFPDSQCS